MRSSTDAYGSGESGGTRVYTSKAFTKRTALKLVRAYACSQVAKHSFPYAIVPCAQVGAVVAFAAVTIIAVSFHTRRSELIQKDDYYLGPLWRTKSDSENVLGSLALTGHVGEPTVKSAVSKVY